MLVYFRSHIALCINKTKLSFTLFSTQRFRNFWLLLQGFSFSFCLGDFVFFSYMFLFIYSSKNLLIYWTNCVFINYQQILHILSELFLSKNRRLCSFFLDFFFIFLYWGNLFADDYSLTYNSARSSETYDQYQALSKSRTRFQ